MSTCILGGGLTGLTIGNHLSSVFEVLEKNADCGGLCRSFERRGFTFDYCGSHIIFSRDKATLDYMLSLLGDNVASAARNTKIFMDGSFVKYPFENGLGELSLKDRFECLHGYIEAALGKERGELEAPANLEEWIYNNFGKGIAEKYMLPYNEKIWAYDCKTLGTEWVEGRVPRPPIEDVIKSALGIPTEGYTHQLNFHYPKRGGIQALISALEAKIEGHIRRDVKIESIRKKDGKWIVSRGGVENTYDRLVSTIPLGELVRLLEDVPPDVTEAISNLKFTSLISVSLGVERDRLNDFSWVYFPKKEDGLFNRISFPSNFGGHVTPVGKSSALVEITCLLGDEIWEMSDEAIIERVALDIQGAGILEWDDVSFCEVRRQRHAYVVYDIAYSENIEKVQKYFQGQDITLCGRFSEFKYLNMDGCIKRALSVADKLNGEENK